MDPATLLAMQHEIAILTQIKHPNTLLLLGAARTHDRLMIVTELLDRTGEFGSNDVLILTKRCQSIKFCLMPMALCRQRVHLYRNDYV